MCVSVKIIDVQPSDLKGIPISLYVYDDDVSFHHSYMGIIFSISLTTLLERETHVRENLGVTPQG